MKCFVFPLACLALALPAMPVRAQTDAGAEALIAQIIVIRESLASGDQATAAAETRKLLPPEESLRGLFVEEADPDAIDRIVAFHGKLAGAPEEVLAKVFAAKPEQTETKAYGVTVEELTSDEPPEVVTEEFPLGAIEVARLLKDGSLELYELEFTEPEQDLGKKYHLFYFDDEQWRMLGPVWRMLRTPAEPEAEEPAAE